MGCVASKAKDGSRPDNPQERELHVGCLDYRDPILLESIDALRVSEVPDSPTMGSINLETGETRQGYQGQLNARLAAMILQKRQKRESARKSTPPTSGESTPTRSRRNSRDLRDTPPGTPKSAGFVWQHSMSGEPVAPSSPGSGGGAYQNTRRSSKSRQTKLKWAIVEVNEFVRDFNCACAQPSSGGLPLGMGMYHVKCSRQSLDEFELSRKLTRIPLERFHITGRLSNLERGKLLDQKRTSRST